MASLWTAGQQAVLHRLRRAQQGGRLHHAYILIDRSGGLAQEVLRRFIQGSFCAELCSQCAACGQLQAENHANVIRIDTEAGDAIKIDMVRGLRQRLAHTVAGGKARFVWINHAERMNSAAQNALLKTLEEPPANTFFFLTATRVAALLPTIRSRSQQLPLPAPTVAECLPPLQQAGVPEQLQEPFALMVGADAERAATYLQQGAEHLWNLLHTACYEGLSHSQALDAAAEIGANTESLKLSLGLLQVIQRQMLNEAHQQGGSASVERAQLAVADRIRQVREKLVFNPNRPMVAESLLLPLCR